MKKTDAEIQTPGDDGMTDPATGALKKLSPAAERSLREAEQRRRAQEPLRLLKEFGGRGGEEPVRYGDWEIKGLASDF